MYESRLLLFVFNKMKSSLNNSFETQTAFEQIPRFTDDFYLPAAFSALFYILFIESEGVRSSNILD